MRPLRLVSAAPVRYALVFAAFSSLVMGILFAVIYWWMSAVLGRHLDESIEAQLQVLQATLDQDGRDSMVGLVREHQRNYQDSPLHYLVQDRSGVVLAGDLPPTEIGPGWHDITLTAPEHGGGRVALRGRGAWLTPDLFVLVTNDTRDLAATRVLLLRSFAIALAATIVLSLAGGIFIASALLRRIEDVNRTAHAIMEGDLSQRIPVIGARDELGGLAEVLNRMLTRIEELMANLEHVTSDIAHDLRTPLGRLRHHLEATQAAVRDRPEPVALIHRALDEVDGLLKTFEAMLRIAQVEAGARRGRFDVVELSAIAENVVDAFDAVAEDEGKRMAATIEPGVRLDGDSELLTQMLANLIENAIRHSPPGTLITVALARIHDGARLEVSDTGPGIPAQERELVFARFYRLDRSRSSPGSGLGLSLVAAIVKLHGGRITLTDNAPGLRVVVEFRARGTSP